MNFVRYSSTSFARLEARLAEALESRMRHAALFPGLSLALVVAPFDSIRVSIFFHMYIRF